MRPDFGSVSEAPGIRVSPEALQMVYHRYQTALSYCEGKDVLEVACGPGMGLGCLLRKAKSVIGGDYTEALTKQARLHYKNRIPILRLDAHALPFQDKSFDCIVLYEAIYYLRDPNQFLRECCRLLRAEGQILVSTVNKEWSDFNPSPLSTRYFSARELAQLFERNKFQAVIYGAFPLANSSVRDALISWFKRLAVLLRLIPKTMKGKEWLKRIFFGELITLPSELNGEKSEYIAPVPLALEAPSLEYKILYAIGRLV